MSAPTGHGQATRRSISPTRVLTTCGALGLAAGLTMAGVAAAGTAHAATTTKLAYTCSAPQIGITFTDPWTVDVDTDYPATAAVGTSFTSAKFDASVTAGDDAATQFRALGVNSWSGSVAFKYAVSGAVTSADDRSAALTVPTTTLPADGPVVTDATGAAADEMAGAAAGTATVTAGDFTASLTTDAGVPVTIDCTLQAGQQATLGTVEVTAASGSSSTGPSSSSSGSSSPSSGSSSPSSGSSSPGTSPTTAPTGTATTTGPPIVTDGGSSDGGPNAGVLGGAALAVAGAALLGVGSARRLRASRR